jgi:death-on-curing protein
VIYYLEFGDYCRIAAEILGFEPEQIAELPNIGLADSALAAPRAGFGDYEAYPDLFDKAAVLVERLARNHPLPDGNKRAAFMAMERFLAANGCQLSVANPDMDVRVMEDIASGKAPPDRIKGWIIFRVGHRD